MSEVTITDDQFHQLLLLQGIDYHPNSFEFAFMKQGYELSRRAAAPVVDEMAAFTKWLSWGNVNLNELQKGFMFDAWEARAALSAPSQPSAADKPVAGLSRFVVALDVVIIELSRRITSLLLKPNATLEAEELRYHMHELEQLKKVCEGGV